MSVKENIAIFETISQQATVKEEVKPKASKEDRKTSEVTQQNFPHSTSAPKPAKGPYSSANLEQRSILIDQKGYSKTMISKILKEMGVFQNVKSGQQELQPLIKTIHTKGRQESIGCLYQLDEIFNPDLVDSALETLGIDRKSIQYGTRVLSEDLQASLNEACLSIQRKQIETLDALIQDFDTAHRNNDSLALIALRESFLEVISGKHPIPKHYEKDFNSRSNFVTGLLRIQNIVAGHYEDTCLEIQREHENELRSLGTANFFNYYGLSNFLHGSEEERREELDAAIPQLNSFFKSGNFDIFDTKAEEFKRKIDEKKRSLTPYFRWVAQNKEFCVQQYDQTKDPRTKVNGSQKHFICQSANMHHASLLARNPTLPFSQLDLSCTNEIIQTNTTIKRNRYQPAAFQQLGLKAPDLAKDVTVFTGEHRDTASIQHQLSQLERKSQSPLLAMIHLDPPVGSQDMGHALLVQMDGKSGSYRFIDVGMGAMDYGDDREAFYNGVTSFMATVYHNCPRVSVQTLHAQ
ncbi:MAG: hypothetical protein KDK96_11440 [Chlamydiia bacterium]|nr:hypothetical protein [Chlamydiia bacterium]